jgi:nucleotidyltransferase AbiEii toxin of type IV toxin-antitoxin system
LSGPEPPRNLASLTARISNAANQRDVPVRRIQRVVANTVIGQVLPSGVVKGGTAIKLRVGEPGSRFTPDFDATRPADTTLDNYIDELADKLEAGWGGFTGTVETLEPSEPPGVPTDYVMQPFRVRLSYWDKQWLSVEFELGHDEIGSTQHYDAAIADDIVSLFDELGLDEPGPIPVLAVEHQVAQKLHACTSVDRNGDNDRAHDLVDLQILRQETTFDLEAISGVAERLFIARKSHEWPPTVVAHARWDTIYAEAADGLAVIPSVEAAVAWANELVAEIKDAAPPPRAG